LPQTFRKGLIQISQVGLKSYDSVLVSWCFVAWCFVAWCFVAWCFVAWCFVAWWFVVCGLWFVVCGLWFVVCVFFGPAILVRFI